MISCKKEIFIHIGLPKTGTSFLQTKLFTCLNDVVLIDNNVILDFLNYVTVNEDFDLEQQEKFYNIMNKEDKSKVIISYESLSGSIYDSFKDFEKNMLKIKKVFPYCKVIFTIRNQVSLIESSYKQSLHEGWSLSYIDYTISNRNKKSFLPFMDYKLLNFYNMSVFLIKNFTQVLVLPQEILLSEESSFIKTITKFTESNYDDNLCKGEKLNSNKGYSLISVNLAYVFNRFLNFPHNSLGFIQWPFESYIETKSNKWIIYNILNKIYKKFTFRSFLQRGVDKIYYLNSTLSSEKYKNKVLRYHQLSNEKLSLLLKIDLAQYGYVVK